MKNWTVPGAGKVAAVPWWRWRRRRSLRSTLEVLGAIQCRDPAPSYPVTGIVCTRFIGHENTPWNPGTHVGEDPARPDQFVWWGDDPGPWGGRRPVPLPPDQTGWVR